MHKNTYKLVNNVLFQKVDNETVILEPENGNYFTLDPIGTLMIENLQKGKNVSQVIDLIHAAYDVTPQKIETDITELISKMVEQKLLILQD